MASPARLAGVGVFVVVGVLLFAIGLFMIGDRQMAFAKKFTLYTDFTKITGLEPGAVVRVSGAKAGSVKDIETPGSPTGKFRVRMEIAESLHPLVRTDSVASIKTEGLVGGSYLGISTGSEQAPRVADGGTIPSREPFEIADLLSAMADTVTKVSQTIDEMKGEIEHTIVAIGDTVTDANDLITSISGDVQRIAGSGARISGDLAKITDDVKNGKGTVGKLFTDDQIYDRTAAVAKNIEQITEQAKGVVAETKQALDQLEAKNGPAAGVAADVRQTLENARRAMAGLQQNMDALKHNVLLRGYFKSRGYFDLQNLTPAEYRAGFLTGGGKIAPARVWLDAAVLFAPAAKAGTLQLTAGGRARLDSALASFLAHVGSAIVVVEGYAQHGTTDEQYRAARRRAAVARDYLIGRYHLDPSTTVLMPLGADSAGSPGGRPWDGVAVAIFFEKKSK